MPFLRGRSRKNVIIMIVTIISWGRNNILTDSIAPKRKTIRKIQKFLYILNKNYYYLIKTIEIL